MNRKKIISNLLTIVLITAINVGFTSCNKDNDDVIPKDYSERLFGKWIYGQYGSVSNISAVEFKRDGIYSFEHQSLENSNGMYRITESPRKIMLIVNERKYEAFPFKMIVSGSNDFDQWWVYYLTDGPYLIIDTYLNNQQVSRIMFYRKEGSSYF